MKYRLAALGKLRRGFFISPPVTTSNSGAKVKGNAEETKTLRKARKRPVSPVLRYVFVAPGSWDKLAYIQKQVPEVLATQIWN